MSLMWIIEIITVRSWNAIISIDGWTLMVGTDPAHTLHFPMNENSEQFMSVVLPY